MDRLAVPADTSAAEELAKRPPSGTPVVKAFNTTFATTLVAGEVAGEKLDVFRAGDDEAAKQTVATLVESGGLRPLDVGAPASPSARAVDVPQHDDPGARARLPERDQAPSLADSPRALM
jgi:predicted dinucleotide-binding enzyme